MSSPIVTRAAEPEDMGLIFHSWLKSFRKSSFSKNIKNNTYFYEHHKVIEHALKRAKVICAVNAIDPSIIYGWICVEMRDPLPVIHYIYVKRQFRHFGVGKLLFGLIPPGQFVYTHETALAEKYPERAIYSPYHMMPGLVA